MDIAQVVRPGLEITTSFLRLHKRRPGIPGKLIGVSVEGLGPRVEIEYTTLANSSVHTAGTTNCSYPLMCPRRGGSIVSAHRLANGMTTGSPWREFRHTYNGARTDLRGRGWLGFQQHDTIDVERLNAVTSAIFDNHTSRDLPLGDGMTGHVYPFAGRPHLITRTITSGARDGALVTYEHRVDRDYEFVLGATPGTWIQRLEEVTVLDRERAGTAEWVTLHLRTTTYDEYDQFENVEKATTLVAGSDQVVELSYRYDEANWLIALPDTQTTTSCTRPANKCVTRESSFDHFPNGNLREVLVEPEDDAFLLSTVIEYGLYGNVEAVTTSDAEGEQHRASVTFDSLGLHPETFTNALGHTTEVNVHAGLGVVLDRYDANGVPTTMKYDGFGRLREVNYPDGFFERNFTLGPRAHFTLVPNGTGGTITAESVLLDELGRPTDRIVPAFESGFSTVRTTYDRLGRISTVSRPFAAGSTPIYHTTYDYDGRDRPVSIQEPDSATVRHEYIGRETHTYDAKAVHSYVLTRTDGLIDSRYENDPESTDWLVTQFEYDPFSLVSRMISPDGTSQVMEYDKLGRRIGHVDPSAGATISTYNPFGELEQEVDGNDDITEYIYDDLGRIRQVNSPDGLSIHNWDTANTGIGKPVNANSPDGIGIGYRYDTIGRPLSTRWNVQGVQYEITYGYDDIGRLASVTYPTIPGAPQDAGRFEVEYVYNPQGYLSAIRDPAAPPEVLPYWTATDRNIAGQLTGERYGNGVVNAYEYRDINGLLNTIDITGPGTTGALGQLSYGYDLNRNIRTRTDLLNGRSDTFVHDELNRLTRWEASNGQTALTAIYNYDKIGNLESETVQGVPNQSATYTYDRTSSLPHALRSRNGASYGYDAAGRQITGPGRTVDYTSFGLPRRLTMGSLQTDFAYDAYGTRVIKRDSRQTVVYVGPHFERRIPAGTGGTEIHNLHNIMADGRVVAQVNRVQAVSGGPIIRTPTFYLHTDAQGTTTLVTNSAGRIADGDGFLPQLFYDPWGRRIDANYVPLGANRHGGPRQGYTGHEHEDEFGLINMRGRIYDPEARRFLTPDPFIQAPLTSRSHNRYSYAWNNPTTFTDPSGFDCIENPNECSDDVVIGDDPGGDSDDVIDALDDGVDAIGDGFGAVAGAFCSLFCPGSGPKASPTSDDQYQTDLSSYGPGGGSGGELKVHEQQAVFAGSCTGIGCLWALRELGSAGSVEALTSVHDLQTNAQIAETKAKSDAVRDRAPVTHQVFNIATGEIGNRADEAEALIGVGLGGLGQSGGAGRGGSGPRVHSVYSDGTRVLEGQQPPRIRGPESAAQGPHSVIRHDGVNNRVYQGREFDATGNPVRDVDFTNPTFPNGTPRPGHPGPPHQHRFEVNDPRVGPRSGLRRLGPEEIP